MFCAFTLSGYFSDAPGQTVIESLRNCSLERDDQKRLTCYDQLSTNARESPANPATAENPRSTPEDEYGVKGSVLAHKKIGTATELKELRSALAAVSALPHGELIFTLMNGQVWVQNQSVQYFPLKVGDAVRIRTGALGSYVLVTEKGLATKVRRLQ